MCGQRIRSQQIFLPWIRSKSGWIKRSGICTASRLSIYAPGTRTAASGLMSRCFTMCPFGVHKLFKSRERERERERERRHRPGSINGFPVLGVPWCQSSLKRSSRLPSARDDQGISRDGRSQLVSETQTHMGTECKDSRRRSLPGAESSRSTRSRLLFSDELQTARSEDKSIVEYLGIAADEPKRFGQLNAKKRAPLVEFGIEEELCGLYCRYNDMLSPTYETSFRDGCWFCHNQGVNQLRLLRRNYPNLWALLMKWDLDSPVSFKADGHTVHDFDRRFQLEDEWLIDPDKPFRWSMLDGDLQYRLF